MIYTGPPKTPPDLEVGTPSPNLFIHATPSNYRPPDVMSLVTSISSMNLCNNQSESEIYDDDFEMASIISDETDGAMSEVSSQNTNSLISLTVSEITTTSERDVLFKLFCELKTFYHEL